MRIDHPGVMLQKLFVEPLDVTLTEVADALGVSVSSVSRVISGKSSISSEMALRISHVFGGDPETWVSLQWQYDLELAKSKIDLSQLKVLNP